MRKDFLVDPYQVLEARAAGAGGVLVILRMLPRRADRGAARRRARELGLFVLLEAFDEADIELAAELARVGMARDAQLLVGVNCRDLATLKVVPERLSSACAAAAARRAARRGERRGHPADVPRAVAAAGLRARAGRQRAHAERR